MRLRSLLAPAFAAGLLAAPAALAQTVCDRGYSITSASDYDEFAADGCDQVTGNVYVSGVPASLGSGLSALSRLTRVGDQLLLSSIDGLTDLSMLANL